MEQDVKMNDGTLNALGVDIKISDIIGEKIVDQWMTQISPEDMQLIFDRIEQDVFAKDYKDEKYFVTRIKKKSSWGQDEEVDSPIWRFAQQLFAKRFNDIILRKVDEIIQSEQYQQRAEAIAEDIVEYATNGYKEDIKNRVKERLVDNTVGAQPFYGGVDLRYIINQEIQNYIHN